MSFKATREKQVEPHTIEGWDLRNKEDLEKCLSKWQKNLRLEDFDIVIKIKRFIDMNAGDSVGRIKVNEWHKCATIRILDPKDYIVNNFSDMVWGYDMEDSVVHELLHIPMFPYTPEEQDSLAYTALEITISTLAEILVQLDRKRCTINSKQVNLQVENERLRSVKDSILKLIGGPN